MKRSMGIIVCMSIFLLGVLGTLTAEEVQQKISIGLGAGLFKTAAAYDYMTVGQSYGGQIKYGLTSGLEIGVSASYGYHYPYNGLYEDMYPLPIRNSVTGDTLSCNDHGRQLGGGGVPGYPGKPYANERAGVTFDRSSGIPLKIEYIPVEFFLQFRSLTQTIFNPYVKAGAGYFMWSAKDADTGDPIEVRYKNGQWEKFEGNHFHILLGLGFEIFPVPNVGIDIGMIGQAPFGDDFEKWALDSMRVKAEVRAGLTFYYGGVKDSDKDGVFDKDDQCPDTPFGAVVDQVGCPVDSDDDGVPDGLDQCPRTPLKAIVDAKGCPMDSDNDGVPDVMVVDPAGVNGLPVAGDFDQNPLNGDEVDKLIGSFAQYLPACVNKVLVRGDGELIAWKSVRACENLGYGYIFGNRRCTPPFVAEGWYGWCGAEYNECQYQPQHWDHACRFVAVRKRKETEPNKGNKQLDLFEHDQYVYRVFVTNLKLRPHNVIARYDPRADVENCIGEAQREGLFAIPSKKFQTNYAYFQIVMLAYNLWRMAFVRKAGHRQEDDPPMRKSA